MSDYSKLGQIDPEYAAAIANFPAPGKIDPRLREKLNGDFEAHIKEALRPHLPPGASVAWRRILNAFLTATNRPDDSYTVADHHVHLDDENVLVRCLTPRGPGDVSFPVLFWIHGGGWIVGNVKLDDYHLRIICVQLQIAIISVEYRLAPEHPFPTGLNDCYDALKWVPYSRGRTVINQALFSGDISRGFLVGGQSSGGNYAAVLAHRARDDPFFENRRLSGTALQIPIVLHPKAYPDKYKGELLSMEEFRATPPLLNGEMMEACWAALGAVPLNPEGSPFLYSSHTGLPPTYVQVCGRDPLRDEALVYEKLLKEHNVPTRLDVYPGVGHGFHLYFTTLTAAVKLNADFKAANVTRLYRDIAFLHVVVIEEFTGGPYGETHLRHVLLGVRECLRHRVQGQRRHNEPSTRLSRARDASYNCDSSRLSCHRTFKPVTLSATLGNRTHLTLYSIYSKISLSCATVAM
ncbi:hypothetical protein IEO21_06799 [Rhodonia placenta]|uniref:Alpha/beta hydrolase fold-3 domain-containing protein n=1 Tax=Rhodonia placenta TaxID=104341 RepID=A0A8H7NZC6_9APHY|nr:hypothetical protein IEO21_06799 [Postia placenta]